MKKKILISSGGSGGHVIPATIFYDHLKDNYDVLISTDKRGDKFINKNKYKNIIFNTPNLSKNTFLLPFNLLIILLLTIKSIIYLKRNKVNTLITTGGYMSFPFCIASKFLNIEIFLFEPNMVIGRANKLFLNSCKKIFCYSQNIKNFPNKFLNKIIVIKPLLRKYFYSKITKKSSSLKKDLNLLIIGGSQGARLFDSVLKKSIIELAKEYKLKVYHQTKIINLKDLKNFYVNNNIDNQIFSYDENILQIISKANLCITRVGASTLSELVFLNIPFLAIPLLNSKDDHQFENAAFYKNSGCCWILKQDNLDDNKIKNSLVSIIENEEDYLMKKKNMHEFSSQNNWKNINQKIISTLNEN